MTYYDVTWTFVQEKSSYNTTIFGGGEGIKGAISSTTRGVFAFFSEKKKQPRTKQVPKLGNEVPWFGSGLAR